jgi:hypothetical protein
MFSTSGVADILSSILACYLQNRRQKGLRSWTFLLSKTSEEQRHLFGNALHMQASVGLLHWIVLQMPHRITFIVTVPHLPLFHEKPDTYKHLRNNKRVGWCFQLYAVSYSSHNSKCSWLDSPNINQAATYTTTVHRHYVTFPMFTDINFWFLLYLLKKDRMCSVRRKYQTNTSHPNTVYSKQCKYSVYTLGTKCKISPHNNCKYSEHTFSAEAYRINKIGNEGRT